MNKLDAPKIITTISVFIPSYIGTILALYIQPGIFLIYIQTFASGSFLGLSILHFFPDAVKCFSSESDKFPIYSCVMVGTFALFSLIELVVLPKYENDQNDAIKRISDDSGKDYSIFLLHRFSAIPSLKLLFIIYVIFLAHSCVIGISIPFLIKEHDNTYLIAVFSIFIEKIIEMYELTIMTKPNKIPTYIIWILTIIYSIPTPLIYHFVNLQKQKLLSIFLSISTGVFLFIGLLFWRKTFLTPFEWKKKELFLVSLWFFIGILIQALTHINKQYICDAN